MLRFIRLVYKVQVVVRNEGQATGRTEGGQASRQAEFDVKRAGPARLATVPCLGRATAVLASLFLPGRARTACGFSSYAIWPRTAHVFRTGYTELIRFMSFFLLTGLLDGDAAA